jgi:hypothetical protein
VAWDDVFSNKGNDELQRMLHAVGLSDDYEPDHEWTGAHAPQPNPPNQRPGTDPHFDHVQQPNPRPSKSGSSDSWPLDPGDEYENFDPISLYPSMMPADVYFKTWKLPILESSEVYPSSNSVPAGRGSKKSKPVESEPESESTTAVQEADQSQPLPKGYLYFNTWKQPILESSDVHTSSSSTPPGTDHGSTSVVQAPASNPASSTANPDPLLEPTGPSSAMQGPWEDHFNVAWDDLFSNKGDDEDDEMDWILHALTSSEYDSDHELTGTEPDFNWDHRTNLDHPQPPGPSSPKPPNYENQAEHVQQSNPGMDPVLDWDHRTNLEHPQPLGLSSSKPPNSEKQAEHVQQPNPGMDPVLDLDYWTDLEHPQPPGPSSPKLPNYENQAEHVQQLPPWTDPDFNWDYWMDLEHPQLPGPSSPKPPNYENEAEHVQQPNPGMDPEFISFE